MKTLRLMLSLALASAALTTTAAAGEAEMVIPQILPYDGLLNLDGIAASGPADMRFTLYDADGAALWTEAWTTAEGRPVELRNGHFHVPLGSHVDLGTTLTAGDVFLGLAVKAPEDEAFIEMAGRQQLTGVARARWAFDAPSLTLAQNLDVVGDVTLTGALESNSMTARGHLSVGNTVVGSEVGAQRVEVSGRATARLRSPLHQPPDLTAATLRATGDVQLDVAPTLRGVEVRDAAAYETRANALSSGAGRYLAKVGQTLQIDPDARHASTRLLAGTIMIGTAAAPTTVQVFGIMAGAGPLDWTFDDAVADVTFDGILNPNAASSVQNLNAAQVHAGDCRICMNYTEGNTRRHSCTSLGGTQVGGALRFVDSMTTADRLELVYVCDGGASGVAEGHIAP